MCDKLDTYEAIKIFTDIAAPTITIFAALLGLFTKTRDEETLVVNGQQVKREFFTKWTWWALGGIMTGGVISIWAVLNDKKISEIEYCIKSQQDSLYNAKVDSVNRQLKVSRDTLAAILETSAKTIEKLNLSYEKQLLGLDKQNTLLVQTENLLHPFSPAKSLFRIHVEINDSLQSELNTAFRNLYRNGVRRPSFVNYDGIKVHVGFHSIQDTTQNSREYVSFEEKIKSLLPEPSLSFYSVKASKKKLIDDKYEVFKIDGTFPTVINKKVFTGSLSYLLEYEYYPSYNLIKCRYVIEPQTPISIGKDLKSLYAIKDGSLMIEFNNKFVQGVESNLRYLILQCGEPAENYMASFGNNDMIKKQQGYLTQKTYYKPILGLINGTNFSEFDLLTGN
ncbi:hypothetical protein J0X19_13570 [Hymenobacter sp. BT186]|uniref:Uncharacterized protein n=1 Tax=Hymenobacter telluris TaxID=2816474 RepID=A0A939EXH2_9BACT|nr:hypothetical protein [Hymenobacter telluris]MBO0358982.1 hypothetical protein [Hymenobacter telluris]MBW3375008.1 hypothetical protein [Hymenobacter norwichensis]